VGSVSFLKLFRYADALDVTLIIVGAICALAFGVALPGFSLLFGKIVDELGEL
jgi:ATP-binding cassette subfamily B (MDR/TAP) protein 1